MPATGRLQYPLGARRGGREHLIRPAETRHSPLRSTLWLHERKERLCVLRNAFAAHPQYGRTLDAESLGAGRSGAEVRMHAAAHAALALAEAMGDEAADWVGPEESSGAETAGRFSRFRKRWA